MNIDESGFIKSGNRSNQVQIYRMAKGWRIFIWVSIPPLLALFAWGLVTPFMEGRASKNIAGTAFLVVIMTGMILLFIYAFLSMFKVRFEIHPGRIRDIGLIRSKEIPLDDIDGFRILAGQTLILLPKNPNAKKIKTSLVFERQTELLSWLSERFTDLDALDLQDEANRILNDQQLGQTEDHRIWFFNKAKRLSQVLNGFGFFLFVWTIFKPEPYQILIWTLLLYPLLALLFVRFFQGALTLDGKEQSLIPNVGLAFILPCILLALRAALDYSILEWNQFWLPFAIFGFSLFFLTLLLAKDTRKRVITMIAPLLFCAVYGYAAVINLNGILDKSNPSIYKAKIMDKKISGSKRTEYIFKLAPWGRGSEEEEVDVGKTTYSNHGIGENADIIVKNGTFGIPWFYVH
jgi:hypothetical protein